MTSLVWVRKKTNLCEICNRVMDIGERYRGRCLNCGLDFCRNCEGEYSVCLVCAKSSLFRNGASSSATG